MIRQINIIPLSRKIKLTTIAIRRQNIKLKIPDAAIAASAVLLHATLLTNDQHLLTFQWPGLTIRKL